MLDINREVFDVDIHVAELNHRYAFVVENGKSVIFREDPGPDGLIDITRMTIQDFKAVHSNQVVIDGKKYVQLGKYWIENPQRRTFDACHFDPDPNRKDIPSSYNLFRGFPVTGRPGDWSLFRRHLLEVGSAGDEETFDFFISWLRLMVQKPHIRPLTAIVLQGQQGVGKGCIAKHIGSLVGSRHYKHVTSVRYVVGNFNGHLQDAIFLFADEAIWAGDKASEGVLKALVTEPTIVLERKGRDAYIVPNYTHMLIATNNEWAVPMEASDRRFVVVNVPDTYRENGEYFKAIEDQMNNGGREAMMWDLMNGVVKYPLRKPRSANSIESSWWQKRQKLDPLQAWWLGRLEDAHITRKEMSWPDTVSKNDLYDDYIAELNRLNIQRRMTLGIFARTMHAMLPGLYEKRIGTFDRTRVWVLPSIDRARDAFAKGHEMPSLGMFAADIPEN